MKYKIIADSSLETNEYLAPILQVSFAPFKIAVEEREFIDDDTLDIDELLAAIAKSKLPSRTAAPSPESFLQYIDESLDCAFIVTISSKLSGSYNAAFVARAVAKERYPHTKVHIFDSLGAGSGETTVAIQIKECMDAGMSFEETVEYVENFTKNDQLYFILDNLDTLIKNGRMNSVKGLIASLLHIKPVLGDDGDGNIKLFSTERTYTKAIDKMVTFISESTFELAKRTCVIAQCSAYSRANLVAEKLMRLNLFRDVQIVPMKGLSSTYANAGGLIIAF